MEIATEYQPQYQDDIALVIFNYKLRELNKKLEMDGVWVLFETVPAE